VRGAVFVLAGVRVQPQHPVASPGKMISRRAAHRAQPNHDYIITWRNCRPHKKFGPFHRKFVFKIYFHQYNSFIMAALLYWAGFTKLIPYLSLSEILFYKTFA
jgi:hypothetical protein